MQFRAATIILAAAVAAACTAQPPAAQDGGKAPAETAPAAPQAPAPPAPEADRTPVSEAPFTATSAQGAATVVQTYYALIEERKYGDAWRLWSDGGRASGMSEAAFAAQFAAYRDYHAEVYAPGDIEGAAGSLYVEVPAKPYGVRADGRRFEQKVTVTLRRVNDVDGSTAEQRRWHIASIADAK